MRGTPQQIIEKYQSLARDKATAGDRILAESFLQHAEHYLRILGAAQAAQSQPRRDERDDDELETNESEQPRTRGEPSSGQSAADEGGRSRPISDGLAVMDANDGPSEIVTTPESLSPPPRRGARRSEEGDDESEEAPRRRTRRAPRRSKEARQEGEPTANEAAPASMVETAEGADAEADNNNNRKPDGADDDEWPQASAIGHA